MVSPSITLALRWVNIAHSYGCLAKPNIYTITTFVSLYDNNGETWAKNPEQSRNIVSELNLKICGDRLRNYRWFDKYVGFSKSVGNIGLKYT